MKIQEMLQLMEEILVPVQVMTNVDLDFSPESLDEIESSINIMFPKEGPAQFYTTYIPFGLYLGEVIVRNIPGATWTEDELEHPTNACIIVPVVANGKDGKAQVYPLRRIEKFFEDRTDGLAPFYQMINVSALGFIDPLSMKKDEWYEKGGFKMRVIEEDKEEKDEV